MNGSRFATGKDVFVANECWGVLEEESDHAIINGNAFKKMAERGNFSEKGFLNWAIKNEKIKPSSNGDVKRQTRIGRSNTRCVFLKLPELIKEEEEKEFVTVSDIEAAQLEFD
jgi:hypothetical protein